MRAVSVDAHSVVMVDGSGVKGCWYWLLGVSSYWSWSDWSLSLGVAVTGDAPLRLYVLSLCSVVGSDVVMG